MMNDTRSSFAAGEAGKRARSFLLKIFVISILSTIVTAGSLATLGGSGIFAAAVVNLFLGIVIIYFLFGDIDRLIDSRLERFRESLIQESGVLRQSLGEGSDPSLSGGENVVLAISLAEPDSGLKDAVREKDCIKSISVNGTDVRIECAQEEKMDVLKVIRSRGEITDFRSVNV